ncbi:DUF6427 family protein [Lutibacter sp.]|uniref:DUF6427 family protein n=1 Tax=Lutibacter sp. TaxID=1925666 RepID=UPI002735F4D2|nr:DUF6427 family protein [Lutibacter sp.]MDP3314292.1 DUF6427 family protein [Lutibacter sp.]
MIANFFSKSKPATIFGIVVLMLTIYISALFKEEIKLITSFYILEKIGLLLVIVLFLFFYNFIIKKNKLTLDNSFGILIVVLFLGAFYETVLSYKLLLSNFMLLLSFRKMYSLHSGLETELKIYDAAFWIGVATIFFSWSVLFLLLIYIGLFIFEKLSFKSLFIPLFGVATPIVIFYSYFLIIDNQIGFYDYFNFQTSFDYSNYNSFKYLVPISFLLTLLLWSFFNVTQKIVLISNKLKFLWHLLISHLLISIIIASLTPEKNGSELFFIIFPASIIIANFFQKGKSKNFKNVLLYLFVVIVIGVHFFL